MPRNTSGSRAVPKSGKSSCSMPFGGAGEFTDECFWRSLVAKNVFQVHGVERLNCCMHKSRGGSGQRGFNVHQVG